MEFWGVEVKGGEPFKVQPGEDMILHLSQASLGEVKKGKGQESVCLFVNVDGKRLALGTLSYEKLPQQLFDLVFDRDFELTHNWKNGSVFFYGYIAPNPYNESSGNEDESESESESEEDIPLAANKGTPSMQEEQKKPATSEKSNDVKESAARKQKVKIVEPEKDVESEYDDDSSDDDDSMSPEDSDEDGEVGDGAPDDDEDDDEDDDDEAPKVDKSSKKRGSAIITPVPDKKAKIETPKKTDGKKASGHVATPHPAKHAGKTPGNKSNTQTPKTEGSYSCKSCNKSFKSDVALNSHNQAKHSAGK